MPTPPASSAGTRRRVAVSANKSPELVEQIRGQLERYFDVVSWDTSGDENLTDTPADMALVFGGDGSILHAARRLGTRQLPIVGINLGRLGFLADLTLEAFVDALPALASGKFRVVQHLMFQCEIYRDGVLHSTHLGLNETAVLAGDPFSILDIDLYVDSELVTTYSCDGLIVSTPVGSTAHSLSAGGPILRKELDAFVISPISPHTLTMRPVVDDATRVYEMVVQRPNRGTAVNVDGQLIDRVLPVDRIRIVKAEPRFQLIEVIGQSYYQTLREKLGWGGRIRQSLTASEEVCPKIDTPDPSSARSTERPDR